MGLTFALSQIFNLPQGFWAVISALVVVQTSIGGTLSASRDRLIGTAIGVLVGGAAAMLRPPGVVSQDLALILCVGGLTLAAAIKPSLKVAPVTAVIMLVGPSVQNDEVRAAGLRVIEIGLGGFIGVLVTLLVFPAPARHTVVARMGSTLSEMAAVLRLRAERLRTGEAGEPILPRQQKIRAGLTALEAAVGESTRETAVRLAGKSVDEAVPRTLWRLRNDTVLIGRATEHDWPPAVRAALAGPAVTLMLAQAEALDRFATAVEAGQGPQAPDLGELSAAFRQAVEHLDQATGAGKVGFETLRQVFGLAYALDGFNRNLADLAARLTEFAPGRRS